MSGYDIRPALADIEIPVLAVIGEQDRLVNPAESEELAEQLREVETLVLPDVGHAAFLEAPDTFSEAVRSFAERVLGAGRTPETGSA
jgi:pimeloyl-ACP methyl ester carboxylesterase